MNEHGISKNVERAIRILDLFRKHSELGVTELANQLRENKSVIHRTVNTLARYGYLKQNPITRGYRLGFVFLEWGSIVAERYPIKEIAHPYLEQLMKETNETSTLSIMLDNEILCIDKVDANLPVKISLEVGHRHVIYAGAAPKAIFAFLPEEKRRSILAELRPHRFNEKTIVDLDQLNSDLVEIRKNGYAFADGEVHSMLYSIAAPIFNRSSQLIGSIGIVGFKEGMTEKRCSVLIKTVVQISKDLSAELGYIL